MGQEGRWQITRGLVVRRWGGAVTEVLLGGGDGMGRISSKEAAGDEGISGGQWRQGGIGGFRKYFRGRSRGDCLTI